MGSRQMGILTGAALALLFAAVDRPAAATTFETSVVISSDGAAADDFGWDVAMEGTTLVVGAPFADIGGNSGQGAVYIFELVGGLWTQVQKLTASDGTEFDLLGWSVAISGDRLVAGAAEANIGANNAQGAAYVFERTGGVWSEVHKLFEPTSIQNVAEYGHEVDVEGDRIVVGAPSAGSAQHGAAYVYDRDEGGPGAWGQVAELLDDIFDTNANFGYDVALDGDLLVVGAQLLDRVAATYQNEGGAYVFRRNASNVWNQAGKLFRTGAQDNERAGSSVAIEGTRIIMGATSVDGAGVVRGAAYVFENPTAANNGWTQTNELTASDAADSDSFGTAVALLGGNAWVGAQGHSASAGQMYRYGIDQGGVGTWGEAEIYAHSAPATNQWLGYSIAATADHVAVGAFGVGGKGAVLVYPAPGGGTSAAGGDLPGAPGPVSAHPNPFNPATTIAFTIDRRAEVEVLVHDLRGARVADLFRGTLDAGAHALDWRADGLPSGVYLATVRTGQTMRTAPITLLK